MSRISNITKGVSCMCNKQLSAVSIGNMVKQTKWGNKEELVEALIVQACLWVLYQFVMMGD